MDTWTAIEQLKNLRNDWNSYGAQPPDDAMLAKTREYLAAVTNTLGHAYGQPVVQPLADPGIALIWRDRWRPDEVEILVTRAGTEWVLLRDQRIVKHGSASDPAAFAREVLKLHVSL